MKNIFKSVCIALLTMNSLQIADATELVTPTEREKVITEVGKLLDRHYIFPEVSGEVMDLLNQQIAMGEYDDVADAHALAERLTDALQSVSHDRHLRVIFDPEGVRSIRRAEVRADEGEQRKKQLLEAQYQNFGFKEVSILNGNIGYVDLRKFEDPSIAGSKAQSVMHFLENTDAVIFDLRANGGGYPGMSQLLSSYLLAAEPILLNEIYKREFDLKKQYWNLETVPGKRRPDVDVYILTSRSTFSAAEDFSYTLKHLERATIIGEPTGGGAHPGGRLVATDRFIVWMPTARSINPITQTNWEGSGVIPDVAVPASSAFEHAHILALENLVSKTQDTESSQNNLREWYLTTLKARKNPPIVNEALLRSYVGKYGPRTLTFENGNLHYQRDGRTKLQLTPINDQLFMVENNDDFRIKIIIEKRTVTAIQGITEDGRFSQNAREIN